MGWVLGLFVQRLNEPHCYRTRLYLQASKLLKYYNNPGLKLNVLIRSNLLYYVSLDKISRLCDAGHDLVAQKLPSDHKSLSRYMQSLHCKYDCGEMYLLFHFLFVTDAISVFHGYYDVSNILKNENCKWNIDDLCTIM